MAAGLHISISAERLATFGPLDFSNSILTSLIVTALIAVFCLAFRASFDPKTKKPGALQNFAEFLVEGLYNIVQGITGDHKKTRFFMPFFLSFFVFIVLNNWLGLFPGVGSLGMVEKENSVEHGVLAETSVSAPLSQAYAATVEAVEGEHAAAEGEHAEEHAEEGGHGAEGKFVPYFRAGTADLNTTLALGVFSIVMTQIVGVKYLGLGYFKKFVNFSDPVSAFVGLLELISEIAKIISFSFRLFGNIFAGEVLLAVLAFLVPLVVPMPFYGMEVFIGIVQALVFSLLSIVFFNMATVSHDGDHH